MKDSEWPSLDNSSGHGAKLRICNRPQDWGAREQVHTVSSRRGGRMGLSVVLGSTASPMPTQTSVQGMGSQIGLFPTKQGRGLTAVLGGG